MDARKWTERQTDKVWELCQHSDRDICPACVADAFAPTITKLVEACRAMRNHSDTCQFILIADLEIPFPCNCGYALAQAALAELEKP